MNRGLTIFSFLLILVGIGSGFYPIVFLGVIFLIPALLVPSKSVPRPRPTVPVQRERAAPPRHKPATAPPPSEPAKPLRPAQARPEPTRVVANPAIFPTTMFPSVSQSSIATSMPAEVQEEQEPRDELIEFAAMLAFMRLLRG